MHYRAAALSIIRLNVGEGSKKGSGVEKVKGKKRGNFPFGMLALSPSLSQGFSAVLGKPFDFSSDALGAPRLIKTANNFKWASCCPSHF